MSKLQATALKELLFSRKVAAVTIHTVASKNFLHFVDEFTFFFNYVRCNVHGPSLCLLLDTAVTMLGIQGEDGPTSMSTDGAGYKLNLTNPLTLGTERILDMY